MRWEDERLEKWRWITLKKVLETAQLQGTMTNTSWLITKPVSSHFSWSNGITLNIKAGTLLSILELCRSWQFYLTCLEGSSLLEPFVPDTPQSMPLSTNCRAINQQSFVPIQSELAQKDSYKQAVWVVQAHIRVERQENQERSERGIGLCSQKPKGAEAKQMGNAPFSSQPYEANQVCINLREDSLTKILLHNKSEHFATVGNKTISGGSTSSFCWENASSLLPLNVKLCYCFGVFSCI